MGHLISCLVSLLACLEVAEKDSNELFFAAGARVVAILSFDLVIAGTLTCDSSLDDRLQTACMYSMHASNNSNQLSQAAALYSQAEQYLQ